MVAAVVCVKMQRFSAGFGFSKKLAGTEDTKLVTSYAYRNIPMRVSHLKHADSSEFFL